jgi:hypothetical protein
MDNDIKHHFIWAILFNLATDEKIKRIKNIC